MQITQHSQCENTGPSALPQHQQEREDCAPSTLILYAEDCSVHAAPGQLRPPTEASEEFELGEATNDHTQ